MNKMLIGMNRADEIRVALVKGDLLYDLEIEDQANSQCKSNIYKGRISRIEPSLDAVFIDYGAKKHGFLPLKEIDKSYFKKVDRSFNKVDIRNLISEGQEILVQVDKDERGNKGAALTTFISLAGAYLVLMPNNGRVGGISRQIEGKEREELKNVLQNLQIPDRMGLIVRTAGVGKSTEELKRDLETLLSRWQEIQQLANESAAPTLIYQERNAAMRAIRDYLRQEIEEIIVDDEDLFRKVKAYVKEVKPDFTKKVKHYQGEVPLFCNYQIEQQIEAAYHRVVKLPSGGTISIDPTEALISIDVNSARATSGGDIEETALNTNLEAAEEIARQLRIRDLGGLIVIDFIDMASLKNQREVSKYLKEALDLDRARVKMGTITRFGLLEMSRQRLRSYLGHNEHIVCPRCNGNGVIRSSTNLALSILRLVEEEAYKQKEGELQVQVPVEVATYFLNEGQLALHQIIQKTQIKITILPNLQLETPQYELKKLKHKEKTASTELLVGAKLNLPDKGVPIVSEEGMDDKIGKVSSNSWLQKLKNWFCSIRIKMKDNNPKLLTNEIKVAENKLNKVAVNKGKRPLNRYYSKDRPKQFEKTDRGTRRVRVDLNKETTTVLKVTNPVNLEIAKEVGKLPSVEKVQIPKETMSLVVDQPKLDPVPSEIVSSSVEVETKPLDASSVNDEMAKPNKLPIRKRVTRRRNSFTKARFNHKPNEVEEGGLNSNQAQEVVSQETKKVTTVEVDAHFTAGAMAANLVHGNDEKS